MRVKEDKKDKLKSIVSHIICETPLVYDVIKNRKCCPYPRFIVKISNDNNSWGSKSNCEVILGVSNLLTLNNICVDFCKKNNYEYNQSFRKSEEYPNDICIDNYCLKESALPDINFLCGDSVGPVEALVINALAFTLYHEFGHVKYDDDSMLQIEKERMADNFALEVLFELCSEEPNIQLEENPKFLGAFLENILILQVSKPKEAEIKDSHPHPIERIYLFLEYFHIDDDSYLWNYAYDTIVKWAGDNHIAITFVKDDSLSIKDKLLDFYHRYKK